MDSPENSICILQPRKHETWEQTTPVDCQQGPSSLDLKIMIWSSCKNLSPGNSQTDLFFHTDCFFFFFFFNFVSLFLWFWGIVIPGEKDSLLGGLIPTHQSDLIEIQPFPETWSRKKEITSPRSIATWLVHIGPGSPKAITNRRSFHLYFSKMAL